MNKKTDITKLTDSLKLKIRNDYVQGIEENGSRKLYSIEELVDKYGVAKSTIYRTSQKENWKFQRDIFQEDYLKKLDEERTKDLVRESKVLDGQSISLAKALYATVGAIIRDNNENIQKGSKTLPPSQVNALANAALSAQRLAKLALGESTENINANFNETEAFNRAMELLDEIESSKSENRRTTH